MAPGPSVERPEFIEPQIGHFESGPHFSREPGVAAVGLAAVLI